MLVVPIFSSHSARMPISKLSMLGNVAQVVLRLASNACQPWRRKKRLNSINESLLSVSRYFPPVSVSPLPAAKRSARRHWACTPTSRAWYVGVSGGLGWCPGKTSGRSASSASLPSAPPIRWDRQRPCPPPRPHPQPGEWKGGCPSHFTHPHGPPTPSSTPACVTFEETYFIHIIWKSIQSLSRCPSLFKTIINYYNLI